MKRIVSVSIGSSVRNKRTECEILGEKYLIERIGTDGSIKKAVELIGELDGKVDVFGMGGIDLHLSCGPDKGYLLREAIPIVKAAKKTPIVDGTGIKNTLEGKVIEYLQENGIIDFRGKNVLMTCAVDRFKMTKALMDCGARVLIGDFIFAFGIPIPIRKLGTLKTIANIIMPIASRLPFEMLYPTGEKQKRESKSKYSGYYKNADIIAGDYHYIYKYLPADMAGKIVITNTVTAEDVAMLKKRGVKMLVTASPEFDGRSFGTNVIEAILVAASGKKPDDLTQADYYKMLDELNFTPRIEYLN